MANVPEQWPRPMYKADIDPISVKNQKAFEEAQADGWSPQYIPREWPRLMYGENGDTKKVNSKKEMEAALKSGWDTKPFPPKPTEKSSVTSSPETVGALQTLSARLDALEEQIMTLTQMLQELTEPVKQ